MGRIGVIAFERFANGGRASKSLQSILDCVNEAERYVGEIKLVTVMKELDYVKWDGLPKTIHKAMRKNPDISEWMIMSLDATYNTGRYNPILVCVAAARNSGDKAGIVHTAFVREVDGIARGVFQGILSLEDIRRYDPFGSCVYIFGKKVFADSGNDQSKLSMRRMLWGLLQEAPLIFVPVCTHVEQLTKEEDKRLHADSAALTTLIGLPRVAVVVVDTKLSASSTEIVKTLSGLTERLGYGKYTDFALCVSESCGISDTDAERLGVHEVYEYVDSSFEEMLAPVLDGFCSKVYSYVITIDLCKAVDGKAKLGVLDAIIQDVVLEERDGVLVTRKLAAGVWMFPQRLAEALDLKGKEFEDSLILHTKSKGLVLKKNGKD